MSGTTCPCCAGSGVVDAASRMRVRVKEAWLDGALCAAMDTVYDNHRQRTIEAGKGWPWLTRSGPGGRAGRCLWIIVHDAVEWSREHGGWPINVERLLKLARRPDSR